MLRLAELTDKYRTMTRAADQGALDGADQVPGVDARSLTETELRIINLAQGDLDELGEEVKGKIDSELASITERASKIPFAVKRTPGEFRVRAEAAVQDADQELVALYRVKLERERDYRLFKVFHRLRREAAPARSLPEAWAYMFLMTVIDGSLNAFFFKDVGTLGLADGFLIAAVIAGCNIALGFLLGWGPLRFFSHRYRLHLLWAIPIFVALVLGIGAFNWGVAHYRDLVQSNNQGGLRDVMGHLRTDAFGILGFPSYLMGLVGLLVAVYSASRGYTMFDAYPWYGWTYKRMKRADNEFLAASAEVKEKVAKDGEKFLAAARKEYEAVNTSVYEVLSDYDRTCSIIDQYEASARSIEDACNAVLRVYRGQNVQVRDNLRFPAPHYFVQPQVLRRRADLLSKDNIAEDRSVLQHRADQLRQSQEELERTEPVVKLDLLSEESMNKRLEGVVRKAIESDDKDQALERRERDLDL